MSEVIVREIEQRDHDPWEVLFAAYNAFYGRAGATALPDDVVNTTWRRFFDPAEPVHALVAEAQGHLVGLVHYLFHRSTIQIDLTCYLQDLYVADDSRRDGVGRKLIQAVCDRARVWGSRKVYWQTHEGNSTAMQLYDKVAERSGFVVYRIIL